MQISWPQNVLHSLHVWLRVWPVCSSVSSHSSIDSVDPVLRAELTEGCWPWALAPAHQRLLMEDVNICSGASRGSPSLSWDCSEHINTSEAKGTSGHAVLVCVRTGEGSGWQCVLSQNTLIHTQTHIHIDSSPSSRLLRSIACIWTPSSPFFLSSWWPSDLGLPFGQGGHGQDSWGQQEPCPHRNPSCLLRLPSHDPCIAFELLPPDTEARDPSWDADCLPNNVTNKNTVVRLDIAFPNPLFMAQDLHLSSVSIPSRCHWLQRLTESLGPISRRCLHSRSLDVRLTWLAATGLFMLGSANKI